MLRDALIINYSDSESLFLAHVLKNKSEYRCETYDDCIINTISIAQKAKKKTLI